jgi:hypothetical protein
MFIKVDADSDNNGGGVKDRGSKADGGAGGAACLTAVSDLGIKDMDFIPRYS